MCGGEGDSKSCDVEEISCLTFYMVATPNKEPLTLTVLFSFNAPLVLGTWHHLMEQHPHALFHIPARNTSECFSTSRIFFCDLYSCLISIKTPQQMGNRRTCLLRATACIVNLHFAFTVITSVYEMSWMMLKPKQATVFVTHLRYGPIESMVATHELLDA